MRRSACLREIDSGHAWGDVAVDGVVVVVVEIDAFVADVVVAVSGQDLDP